MDYDQAFLRALTRAVESGSFRTRIMITFLSNQIIISYKSIILSDLYLQGGEVVQETITSSVSDDTCTLEFQRSDGTLVTKLIDFRSVSTCVQEMAVFRSGL